MLCAPDYYDAGLGIVGSWGGKGAVRLGLNGIVDTRWFRRLCDNQNPRIGSAVTVRNARQTDGGL